MCIRDRFGYASSETQEYMPLALALSHKLLEELALIRKEGHPTMHYLRPDSKAQVTIEYSDDNKPLRVNTIVLSTQHDEFDGDDAVTLQRILQDVKEILIPRTMAYFDDEIRALLDDQVIYHVNPTGKFVIGGPHGDTGLTGRKIIVDTYGGKGGHGGGAFSGKDPSKVDRSAAYAARHLAKNLVASGLCDEVLVQVAYAIGVADPVSLFINTYGTSATALTDGEIARKVQQLISLRPYDIEQRFKLRDPIYLETAAYGHMGRPPEVVTKRFVDGSGRVLEKEVTLFPWEKLDYVDTFKKAFAL